MNESSYSIVDIAAPLCLAAALNGCGESPCLDAKEYDFSNNPENTQAFYDDGIPLSSCYHPARNSVTPTLGASRIPLHFNILYYEGIRIENIREGIKRDLRALNYAFDKMGVTFYPVGTTEIEDNGALEFIRNMDEDDSGENFDLRLSRQFMDVFPKTSGFPVYYFPKTDEHDGLAILDTAPFIYYATPEYNDKWRKQIGYTKGSKNLAHEMGHMLELEHPSRPDGKGDGLSDTLDYYKVFDIPINDWSPYPVETSVENGVCYVGNLDECEGKAPANVMDPFRCAQDVPQDFSLQQLKIMNCTFQAFNSPLFPYVNKELPKVEL